MDVPIVSFVGRSNSGKTTLIERVIPELVRAGYKVATVKHAGHGFDLDTEGKDSWRHKRAGASSVVVLSWNTSSNCCGDAWRARCRFSMVICNGKSGFFNSCASRRAARS